MGKKKEKPQKTNKLYSIPDLIDVWQRELLEIIDDENYRFDVRDWRNIARHEGKTPVDGSSRELLFLAQQKIDSLREALKNRLNHFRNEVEWEIEYSGPNIHRVGHRQYDQLIEEIFDQSNSGISREAFLGLFLDRLEQIDPPTQRFAVFVIERFSVGKSFHYAGGQQRHIHPRRWKNFCHEKVRRFSKSALMKKLFDEKPFIQLWRSDYIEGYQNEFRSLLDIKDEAFWMVAAPLPSTNPKIFPDRYLFLLYPEMGDGTRQTPPPGANQETRCVHFLAMAYRNLEHQLRSARQLIAEERDRLLSALAPGILHHEIGHHTRAIAEIAQWQKELSADLWRESQDPDAERMLFLAVQMEEASRRIEDIAHAVNALERRRPNERFLLQSVLKEAGEITRHRLSKQAIQLRHRGLKKPVAMRSDPGLLLLLVVNILLNAANAFQDFQKRPAGGRIIQVRHVPTDDQHLLLYIENNGPPIPTKIKERIFERGFTTRRGGHGQGLYICRIIAQYLGGQLTLAEKTVLPKGMKTGFELYIPLIIKQTYD